METLHFAATPFGAVRDHRVPLCNEAEYERALAWLLSLEGRGVERVAHESDVLQFLPADALSFALPLNGRVPKESMGGNTWNACVAAQQVVGSLEPSRLPGFTFSGIETPKLSASVAALHREYLDRGWPLPRVILECIEGARIRCNHVLGSPKGKNPLYVERKPFPRCTGPLPDVPHLFVSSAGEDLYDEILAHRKRMETKGQTPYLYLAPGSAQVRRGIPENVLSGVHFLSCNWEEAIALAKHLHAGFGSEPSPYDLAEFFGTTIGVDEVRITRGERGICAWSDQRYISLSSFPRDNSSIQALVLAHGLARAESDTWTNPDLTGCGDTRLGTELALRYLGIGELHQQLCAANAMAALQTFNPGSNIGDFPPDLIREVVDNAVHHSWVPRLDHVRRAA